ncbi:hypothetical protein OROMI_017479 [Orobanche minor]
MDEGEQSQEMENDNELRGAGRVYGRVDLHVGEERGEEEAV